MMSKRSLFSLMVFLWTLTGSVFSNVVTNIELQELEVGKLASVLNRTHTNAGFEELKKMLAPTNDLPVILKHQEALKALTTKDDIYFGLKNLFEKVLSYDVDTLLNDNDLALAEQMGLASPTLYYPSATWDEDSILPRPTLKSSTQLKKSALSLDSMFITQQMRLASAAFALFGLNYVASAIRGEYILTAQNKNYISPFIGRGLVNQFKWLLTTFKDGASQPIYWALPVNRFLSKKDKFDIATIARCFHVGGTWKDNLDLTTMGAQEGLSKVLPDGLVPPKTVLKATVGAPVATLIAYSNFLSFIGAARGTIPVIKNMYVTVHAILDRMIRVKQFLGSLKEFASLVKNNIPEMHEICTDLLAWDRACSDTCNDLMNLLASSTFKDKDAILYRRGKVLRAAYLLKDILEEIQKVYFSFAKIDAYFSLATVCREFSSSSQQTLCFVDFVKSETPLVEAIDTWLPTILSDASLKPENIITNDILLNEKTGQKIVISGPNGTGKSMSLKTLGIGAILAQSIGIFPAKACRMSLFDTIKTSIAPDEDNAQGLSRFGAELLALEDIRAAIKSSTNQNKQILVLIDEPCRGTHPEETARRFCEFCKDVAQNKNLVLSCASHSSEVPSLESETGGAFSNYQMEVQESTPGIFKRTYLVKKGAATWWFNDQTKRSRYVDWFLSHIVKPKMNPSIQIN